jgi:hypothetical protein
VNAAQSDKEVRSPPLHHPNPSEPNHPSIACRQSRCSSSIRHGRPTPPLRAHAHGQHRLHQLRKLYWGLKDNEALVMEACKRDLGKSSFETYLTELSWCMNDIIFMSKNLARFAKDETPEDIAFTNKMFGPRIKKDPLGTVLVIGYAPISSPPLSPQ